MGDECGAELKGWQVRVDRQHMDDEREDGVKGWQQVRVERQSAGDECEADVKGC